MDTKGADLSAITRGVYILEVSLRGGLPVFYVMLWYCTTRLIITVQLTLNLYTLKLQFPIVLHVIIY